MTDLDHRGRPRVAVTGVGLHTPAGAGLAANWAAMLAGRSAARPITTFDASGARGQVRVRDPRLRRRSSTSGRRRAGGSTAARSSGSRRRSTHSPTPAIPAPTRPAAPWSSGAGVGGLVTLEQQLEIYRAKGPDRVSPFFVPMMMPNSTAGLIGIHLGWNGPMLCIATACAASANAIGEGTRLIRDETVDVVLAGGTEASLIAPAVAAFARMGALSKRNDDPAARVAPVRRRPRRVRDGRGRGVPRARAPRPCRRARRADLRRGRGLRRELGRVPHHRAVAGWRRRRGVHAARARRRRASAPTRSGTSTRTARRPS